MAVVTSSKVYCRGNVKYTVADVAAIIGCDVDDNDAINVVRQRLVRWGQGKLTTEKLLMPISKRKKSFQYYENELLSKIPGPTEYEKSHPEIFG